MDGRASVRPYLMAKPTIKIIQGATLRRVLRTPWNLTGYAIAAQLRDKDGAGDVVANFTCTLQTNPATNLPGQVELELAAAATATLTPGQSDLVFDVKLTAPGGIVIYTPRCWLSVSDRVTA